MLKTEIKNFVNKFCSIKSIVSDNSTKDDSIKMTYLDSAEYIKSIYNEIKNGKKI